MVDVAELNWSLRLLRAEAYELWMEPALDAWLGAGLGGRKLVITPLFWPSVVVMVVTAPVGAETMVLVVSVGSRSESAAVVVKTVT